MVRRIHLRRQTRQPLLWVQTNGRLNAANAFLVTFQALAITGMVYLIFRFLLSVPLP